jgi:hypothetical protein
MQAGRDEERRDSRRARFRQLLGTLLDGEAYRHVDAATKERLLAEVTTLVYSPRGRGQERGMPAHSPAGRRQLRYFVPSAGRWAGMGRLLGMGDNAMIAWSVANFQVSRDKPLACGPVLRNDNRWAGRVRLYVALSTRSPPC